MDLRRRDHHRPSGPGVATSVGMAIAGKWMAALNSSGSSCSAGGVRAVRRRRMMEGDLAGGRPWPGTRTETSAGSTTEPNRSRGGRPNSPREEWGRSRPRMNCDACSPTRTTSGRRPGLRNGAATAGGRRDVVDSHIGTGAEQETSGGARRADWRRRGKGRPSASRVDGGREVPGARRRLRTFRGRAGRTWRPGGRNVESSSKPTRREHPARRRPSTAAAPPVTKAGSGIPTFQGRERAWPAPGTRE